MVEELGISERLMAKFGEHCDSRHIAALQPQSRFSRLGSHQRLSYPAQTLSNTNTLAAVPDVQCLSALLLSKRTAAIGRPISTSTLPISADELLPASVRSACKAFVEFAPQVEFGANASNSQSKKGYKQPVCAFALHPVFY